MTLDKYCEGIVLEWDLSESSIVLFVVKFANVPIWIFGILSNLVNIVVYRHRNMEHPINLIFLWLSVSDLLELAAFALLQWFNEWDDVELYGGLPMHSYGMVLLNLSCIYMFQVFHLITISLNIALAFWRYLAMAHPFMHNRIPCNNRNVKLAIIGIYALSFVSYLPVWYMLEIRASPSYEPTFVVAFRSWETIEPYEYTFLILLSVFIDGVVSRVGPLIILIIFSTLLICAVVKTYRNRQRLGIQVSHISESQTRMNQTNITIIVIVLMFIITEVPFGISGLLVLKTYYFCSVIVTKILAVTVVLNSSYNIVCYLITSRQYRETLKLLINRSERAVVQPNLELRPLKGNKQSNNS